MLERVPLAMRLAALIAVPLLVVVVTAAARVQDFRADQAEAVSFSEQMDDVVAIDHAIRALQTERDLSLQLYTLPDGDLFEAELLAALEAARDRAQVAIADAGLSEALPLDDLIYEPELESARPVPVEEPARRTARGSDDVDDGGAVGRALTSGGRPTPAMPRFVPSTLTELHELGEVRTAGASRVEELYSGLIAEYQRELMAAAGIDGSVVPASYLVSYQNVLWGTEQFARVRVLGLLLLADDDPDPGDLRLLGQTNDQERFFLAQAEDIAQPEQQRVLSELLGAPAVVSFDEVRRALLVEGGLGDAVTREVWLTRTHGRLAALTNGADAFLAELLAQVDSSVAVAQRQYMQTFATSVVVVLAVAFGAWVVTRSISDPLRRLAVAARNASVGRLTRVDAPPSRDAIGEIGRAYQELTLYMHTVSDAAEEIASGNMRREIHPRSPDDRLGTALHSMTRQLSSMVTRSQQRSRELAETVGELQETVARDALTGLVRFGARDLLLTPGRWSTFDPLRFAATDTNLQGYVRADPINHSDPSGLLVWVPLVEIINALAIWCSVNPDKCMAVVSIAINASTGGSNCPPTSNSWPDLASCAGEQILQVCGETLGRTSSYFDEGGFARDWEAMEQELEWNLMDPHSPLHQN